MADRPRAFVYASGGTESVGLLNNGRRCGAIAIAAFLLLAGPLRAEPLSGKVAALADGTPVEKAMVTITFETGTPGPHAVTVFTGKEGNFAFPSDTPPLESATSVRVRKLGFGSLEKEAQAASDGAVFYLRAAGNIASGVPASAWLAIAEPGQDRDITVTSCSSCHQLASPRMREYAAQIEAVSGGPDGDRVALEEWRKVVRHEAWRTIVKYMRSMHYAVFPLESKMNIDAIDWQTAQAAGLNFFNAEQGDTVAQYLAEHFPKTTEYLDREAYSYGAELGVTGKTVIREYALPEMALVRELVPVPNTRYLWGADVRRNKIVRLDPESGATKWYEVDFDGSTGPHTIVSDDKGDLWVSMVDNDQFGHFDPETEEWTLWTLRPANLPNADSIAGAAIVHDMSIDSHGRLSRDRFGKIWLTIVGTNQMGTLDTETGRVAFYDTHQIGDQSAINHLLYSTVISPDGTCAWFSQVNGWVGCIDTDTKEVAKLIPFDEGKGPRRMARDDNGTLWVALFGSGQVARIDMESAEVTATYDLPDRASAPYAVMWDERRQAVWVSNANSDTINRLDPETGEVTVYPLPRPMAYLRKAELDEEGRLVATYGNYPEGSGPSMGVVIDVGD